MKNIFIIGDSHCRDMQPCIKQFVKSDCRVNCISHPGKTFNYVVDSIKPSKLSNDTQICIFAGTNDVFNTKFEDLTRSFQKLYNKCRQFKVLIILIPPRYDKRHMNRHIVKLNSKLKHLIKTFDNFDLIDPTNFIQHQHFSHDGLHLNLKGKNFISKKLVTKIFGRVFSNKTNNDYMNKINKSKNVQQYHDRDRYHHRTRAVPHQSYRVPPVQCSHQERNLPCLVPRDMIPPPFTPQMFPPLPSRSPPTPPNINPNLAQNNNMNQWNPMHPISPPIPPYTQHPQYAPLVAPYQELAFHHPPHFSTTTLPHCPPHPQYSTPSFITNQPLNFHQFETTPQ